MNPSNEEETFAIPCTSGPYGTPHTIRWLIDETSRRYKDLYKKAVSVHNLVMQNSPRSVN